MNSVAWILSFYNNSNGTKNFFLPQLGEIFFKNNDGRRIKCSRPLGCTSAKNNFAAKVLELLNLLDDFILKSFRRERTNVGSVIHRITRLSILHFFFKS